MILDKPKPLKFSLCICKMETIIPHHILPGTVLEITCSCACKDGDGDDDGDDSDNDNVLIPRAAMGMSIQLI